MTVLKECKREAKDWEKIFANFTSNKELVSRSYKELFNSTVRKQITQFKNGQNIRTLHQRDYMAEK